MKNLKTFVDNLANKVNQPHYLETELKKVFEAGRQHGLKQASPYEPTQPKPFITAAIYPLLNDVFKESITASRFAEILNEIAYKYFQEHSAWTSTHIATPALLEGKDYSDNVLAIVEGYHEVQVMCYVRMPDDNDCYAWANAYGNIQAEYAAFDDDYKVLYWQYLPKNTIDISVMPTIQIEDTADNGIVSYE